MGVLFVDRVVGLRKERAKRQLRRLGKHTGGENVKIQTGILLLLSILVMAGLVWFGIGCGGSWWWRWWAD